MVHNLRERYRRDLIYTWVSELFGALLIARIFDSRTMYYFMGVR